MTISSAISALLNAWRDGTPTPHKPLKTEIRAGLGELGDALTDLSNRVIAAEAILENIEVPEAYFKTLDVIAAMGDDLPEGRNSEVFRLIKKLYQLGAYDEQTGLDAFYMLRAHSEQAACVNWINPGLHDLVPINSPFFFPDVGVQGDHLTSYYRGPHIDDLSRYQQNSACMGILIVESQFEDSDKDCGFDGNYAAFISAHNISNGGANGATIFTHANNTGHEFTGGFNTPIGLTAWSKRTAGTYQVMAVRDTSVLVTENVFSADALMPTGNFCIGRGGDLENGDRWSANIFGCAFVGGGWEFTEELRDALYEAIVGGGE